MSLASIVHCPDTIIFDPWEDRHQVEYFQRIDRTASLSRLCRLRLLRSPTVEVGQFSHTRQFLGWRFRGSLGSSQVRPRNCSRRHFYLPLNSCGDSILPGIQSIQLVPWSSGPGPNAAHTDSWKKRCNSMNRRSESSPIYHTPMIT